MRIGRLIAGSVAAAVLLLATGSAAAQTGFGGYSYDWSGNITSIGSHTFRYDAFGRLQKSDIGTFGTQTYTYDRYGNIVRIERSTDSVAAIPSVDPETNQMNAPFAVTGGNLIAQYDAAGNLIEHQQDVFVYDALNMIKETTDPERRLHVYAASGERVMVVTAVNNVETKSEWTLRDPGNRVLRRLEKASGSWTWKEDYLYGGGRLLAAEVPTSERVRHFHLDHLGTPRVITGNGGVRLAEKTYEPFGPKLTSTTDGEQLEFTGHERDVPTLDSMHARYYHPYLGRFLSVDPLLDLDGARKSPQMWNRYAYVRNNPMNATDPTGMYMCQGTESDCAAIEARIEGIRQAAAELHPEHEGRPVLEAIAEFYGDPNTENNVIVNVSGDNRLGATSTTNGVTTIRVNLERMDGLGTNRPWVDAAIEGSAILAHEGQHGISQRTDGLAPSFARSVDREERGYMAQVYVNMGRDQPSAFGLWTPWNGFNRDRFNHSVMESVYLHCTQPNANCQ